MNWILLIFCLINAAVRSSSADVINVFQKVKRCPVTGSGINSINLGSQLKCASNCQSNPRCNAFHYQTLTGLCFLGDACASANKTWTGGECESFVYVDAGCSDGTNVLCSLQMKLFYRFRQKGLVNEVNPRLFCLRASNVTIGSSEGARFEGSIESYLSTETPGFDQFLDYNTTYSYFIRVKQVVTTNSQVLGKFSSCAGDLIGNTFKKLSQGLVNIAFWTKADYQYRYSQSDSSVLQLSINDHPYSYSAGVTFNGTHHTSFYRNGSILNIGGTQLTSPGNSVSPANFQCFFLGLSTVASICFNGTMQCFGLSLKVLNVSEFRQLDALCDANY